MNERVNPTRTIRSGQPDQPAVRAVALVTGGEMKQSLGPAQKINGVVVEPQRGVRQEHILYLDEETGEMGVMPRGDAGQITAGDLPQIDRTQGGDRQLPREIRPGMIAEPGWHGHTNARWIESGQHGGDPTYKLPKNTNLAAGKLR